ncbi:hypothetical protein [Falsigemmobacter faecalis]|uniref:GIY-YIG nuclease family protein n=1 Tax=Falsigemmobacter faecalis TaxID=2488730 RepID=A0A3P3DUR9_9RHOB|nr:hypothetical protein [Falsigemmobacter faecalis]RRH77915.1 hypothetical protein EG244_02510 [Falsigemmobacter faecalis]
MIIEGIRFDMSWQQGHSPEAALPKLHGIYCEVLWPVRGIRIGVSQNIAARHRGHKTWMRSMKKGTGNRSQRSGPLANHAKDWGDLGLETFALSTDPRLADPALRLQCETVLHRWAETQRDWKNFNGEKWRPANYGHSVLDEQKAADQYGILLRHSRAAAML